MALPGIPEGQLSSSQTNTESVSLVILGAIELRSREKQPGFCCVLCGSLGVADLPP